MGVTEDGTGTTWGALADGSAGDERVTLVGATGRGLCLERILEIGEREIIDV